MFGHKGFNHGLDGRVVDRRLLFAVELIVTLAYQVLHRGLLRLEQVQDHAVRHAELGLQFRGRAGQHSLYLGAVFQKVLAFCVLHIFRKNFG